LQTLLGMNFDPDHPQHIKFYWTQLLVPTQLALLGYCHGGWWAFALFMAKNGIASHWYLLVAFINHNTKDAWDVDRRSVGPWREPSFLYGRSALEGNS
jgi:hypothetical protein